MAEKRRVDLPLQPGLLDTMSVQIALMHELLAGGTPKHFVLVDKDRLFLKGQFGIGQRDHVRPGRIARTIVDEHDLEVADAHAAHDLQALREELLEERTGPVHGGDDAERRHGSAGH